MRLIDADVLKPHEQLEPMGNGKYEYVEVVYKNDIDDAPTIDAVPTIGQWIPCSERLPEENERDYLVTYNWTGPSGSVYTEVEIVEFRRGRWMIGEENRVVAWCPLPEPWKGEASE